MIMEEYIGTIMLFAGNWAPKNWAYCQGQLLPIQGNEALFSIIGATYGGDARTNFALPDLRGRVPVGMGAGAGLSNRRLGEKGGAEVDYLTIDELPPHTHTMNASAEVHVAIPVNTQESATTSPKGAYLAKAEHSIYMDEASTNDFLADPQVTSNLAVTADKTGAGQPHNNMQPYLGVNYIICINGIYPSRS
jgi:microcystin-dependent protein